MRLPSKYLFFIAAGLGLVLISGIIASGRVSIGRPMDETWKRIEQTRTLRVGMDASYPPFENLDGGGSIVGFDVDLANEIGRQLGVRTVLVNIAYDGLSDALLSSQVDILISALTAPPQLEGKAWFSMPYFDAGEALVIPSGSRIRTMADLKGRTLAVEYGSEGDVEARKWERRLANLTVKRYPLSDAALDAVAAGEVDASLADGIAARLGMGRHSELRVAQYITDAPFVIIAPEDSPTLQKEINAILQDMLQDEMIDQITDTWFGSPGGSE